MVGSFVAWTLVLCLLVILGYKSMQIHYTVEECEMTWMFHPPHYQVAAWKVFLFHAIHCAVHAHSEFISIQRWRRQTHGTRYTSTAKG